MWSEQGEFKSLQLDHSLCMHKCFVSTFPYSFWPEALKGVLNHMRTSSPLPLGVLLFLAWFWFTALLWRIRLFILCNNKNCRLILKYYLIKNKKSTCGFVVYLHVWNYKVYFTVRCSSLFLDTYEGQSKTSCKDLLTCMTLRFKPTAASVWCFWWD